VLFTYFTVLFVLQSKMEGASGVSQSAGGAAKRKAVIEGVVLPQHFHCREGSHCLSTEARWLAWVERDALRAEGVLPADPKDVRPPLPGQGYAVDRAEALTLKSDWFLECGHFVCSVPHAESKHRVCCRDTHKHRCKGDGFYKLDKLRKVAEEQGVLKAKLKKIGEGSDKVCLLLKFHSRISRMKMMLRDCRVREKLRGSLCQLQLVL
jgi:hypothetical protein